jgi:hypothetical protein
MRAGGGVLPGVGLATIAANLASVAGLVALGPVGWAAVVVGGAAVGAGTIGRAHLRDMEKGDARERREAIRKTYMPYLKNTRRSLDDQLREANTQTRRAIAKAFTAMLEGEAERLRESQEALADAARRTKSEAAERAGELRGPLSELERMREAAGAQAQAALAAGKPGPVAALAAGDPVE